MRRGIWATDLIGAPEGLRGTVDKKLEKMGGFIYEYGLESCGVCESRKELALQVVKSRLQQEIITFVQVGKRLRGQWRKATINVALMYGRMTSNLGCQPRKTDKQGRNKLGQKCIKISIFFLICLDLENAFDREPCHGAQWIYELDSWGRIGGVE